MLTQLEEIARALDALTNGADAALLRSFVHDFKTQIELMEDLKACVLSMAPTDFTNNEFCQQTLDKVNTVLIKHRRYHEKK